MATRRKKRDTPAGATRACRHDPLTAKSASSQSRGKLWLSRLLAVVLAPLICFALLEWSLRLVGFGYPSAFLRPTSHQGRAVWVQNNQFAWRYFGSQMGR